MSISRAFLITGGLYPLVGISFGIYMGATQEFGFAPLHAHINLLGFVLMTLFGIFYALFPAMAGTVLAKAHFWLHQAGALVLLVLLFLLFSGRIAETSMVPWAPIAEVMVLLSVAAYLMNLVRSRN